MNKLLSALSILLFMLIPFVASAQPVQPLPPHGYVLVKHCYTALLPFPHSRCEWVRVRRDYTPRYMPVVPPPPRGPRPGYHPAPPPRGPHPGPGPGHHPAPPRR